MRSVRHAAQVRGIVAGCRARDVRIAALCAAPLALLGAVLRAPAADDAPAAPLTPPAAAAESGQYDLAAYGPIKTPAEAQEALTKALADVISKGGGVLV